MKPLLKLENAIFPISFQDKGRRGLRKFGVAWAGHMDPQLAKMANLMVGNFLDEVLIEYAIGGLRFSLLEDCKLAILGAGGMNMARFYKAGEEIRIPALGDCMWGYIAIKGGFTLKRILGSCSFHSRSSLGPELKEGSLIYGQSSTREKYFGKSYILARDLPSLDQNTKIRVVKGLHADELDFEGFMKTKWKISDEMDRSGYRLIGKTVPHQITIKSLPVLPGCIQMTPSGQPVVTMNDGPTVGGYPLMGVIHPEDLACFAQAIPGKEVEFTKADVDQL